jgi:hypothetical protein
VLGLEVRRFALCEQADLSEIPGGEGQTLRPARASDAEAIAAVANAMSERLYGEADVSVDEIRRCLRIRDSRPGSSR